MRDNYPFGLSTVPLSQVVRLHSSSGTTGTPTVILHTQRDLDEWANAVARCLYMVGLRPGDIFQNSSGYVKAAWDSNTARSGWECLPFLQPRATPNDR